MTDFDLHFHGLRGFWTISEPKNRIICIGKTKKEALEDLSKYLDEKEGEDE